MRGGEREKNSSTSRLGLVFTSTLCLVPLRVRPLNIQVTIRYDTIAEFNVDEKAECDQLNLAHVAGKNYEKETETCQTRVTRRINIK